jgi:hypothetical protein
MTSSKQLHHVNLPSLREAVVAAGGFTDELRFQLRSQLQALAAQSDAIIVTCAILGAAVDGMADIAVPVIRADAALARAATAQSGRLTVLCAAQAALPGVQALFCGQEKSAELMTVTHVPDVRHLTLHPRFFQTHIPLMRLGAESTALLSFLLKGTSMSNLRFFLILSLLANAFLAFLFITDGGIA